MGNLELHRIDIPLNKGFQGFEVQKSSQFEITGVKNHTWEGTRSFHMNQNILLWEHGH